MRAVFARHKKIFFVGIGGIGMQGLALLLAAKGYTVGGSDRKAGPALDTLAHAGIRITLGHREENIAGYDILVYTLAADSQTPELVAARRAAMPCFSRADLLGYVMSYYPTRIGVAGMHGKSSTTAMLAATLQQGGIEPTVLCGAPLRPSGSSLLLGGEEVFLCEACEYKDSFLCLYPSLAVVLNCEWEHTDYFSSLAQVRASFHTYISRADTVILPADASPDCLPPTVGRRVLRFGLASFADIRACDVMYEEGCASFTYQFCGITRGHVRLAVPGAHNLQNALAVLGAAEVCRVPFPCMAAALAEYHGIARRLQVRGMWRRMTVYEDYAHHPTEVKASLAAMRLLMPPGARLFCVFQPHTYSRTASFFDDFLVSFEAADRLLLLDIYAAREENQSGVNAAALAAKISHATYAPGYSAACALLQKEGRAGDRILVMGAGDIPQIFQEMQGLCPCIPSSDVVE